MAQLCDALIQINKGIKEPNRVIWHLESYCYYLQLLIFDGQYKVVILESNEFDSPSTVTKEISGNFGRNHLRDFIGMNLTPRELMN